MTLKKRLIVHATSVSEPTVNNDDCEHVILKETDFLTSSEHDCSYSEIKTVGFAPNEDMMAKFYKLLSPKAKLLIESVPSREVGQSLAVDLKIQGFLDIMVANDPASGERFIVCQKPDWALGASAAVKIVPKAVPKVANKWKMEMDDLGESDLLIDEDTLIDKDFQVPVDSACGEDSGAGKKRACADCSCGLAEEEAAVVAAVIDAGTVEEKLYKASSCGGCSKGDAFRCGGCPFLGKPAFEPGNERVMLAMDADDF